MPKTPAGPVLTTPVERRGRKPSPEKAAQMRAIAALCSAEEQTSASIAGSLGLTQKRVQRLLWFIGMDGRVLVEGFGPNARWSVPRPQAAAQPANLISSEIPTVRLPDRSAWLPPAVAVEVRDGVRYTRQGAPRGRYELHAEDLPPNGGVITQDWQQRRAAQKEAAQ